MAVAVLFAGDIYLVNLSLQIVGISNNEQVSRHCTGVGEEKKERRREGGRKEGKEEMKQGEKRCMLSLFEGSCSLLTFISDTHTSPS